MTTTDKTTYAPAVSNPVVDGLENKSAEPLADEAKAADAKVAPIEEAPVAPEATEPTKQVKLIHHINYPEDHALVPGEVVSLPASLADSLVVARRADYDESA
jgi:hypothetical protein